MAGFLSPSPFARFSTTPTSPPAPPSPPSLTAAGGVAPVEHPHPHPRLARMRLYSRDRARVARRPPALERVGATARGGRFWPHTFSAPPTRTATPASASASSWWSCTAGSASAPVPGQQRGRTAGRGRVSARRSRAVPADGDRPAHARRRRTGGSTKVALLRRPLRCEKVSNENLVWYCPMPLSLTPPNGRPGTATCMTATARVTVARHRPAARERPSRAPVVRVSLLRARA